MKDFLIGLLYENGKPSKTGIAAAITFSIPLLLWVFVTLFCLFAKYTFAHYDTLSTCVFGTSTSGALTMAVNKFINSKYNSEETKFPEK